MWASTARADILRRLMVSEASVQRREFSVLDAVMVHARLRPAAIALVTDDERVSYAELLGQARAASAWLAAQGVGAGDRVATALDASPTYLALLLGVLLRGAVAAPLNTRLTAADLAPYVSAIEPIITVDEEPELDLSAAPVIERRSDRSPALILGTGGTTGRPKGAVFSGEALFRWTTAAIGHQHVRRTDVALSATPFFHGFLVSGVLTMLVAGGTVRLMRRFDAERALRAIVEDGVTTMSAPPTMLVAMTRLAGREAISSRVRRVLFSASAPPAGLAEGAALAFPSAELVTGYGTTEFGPSVRLYLSEEDDFPLGCVGRPIPTVEVSVRDDVGMPCPTGVTGEIVVRSPWQMTGYVGPVDGDVAKAETDGALRSGDLGEFDADGRLLVRGRRKEMISTGGENVFPAEVEAVLSAHPDISAIAVYGVADPYWGERVEAAIVPRHGVGVTVEELRAFAAERLAGYKLPKVVRMVSNLPLTSNSKVDRRALQRQAVT